MNAKLIKTKTGFYLWRNPLDKSQELLGATVPIMNDNGVDLREYILSLKNCQEIENGYDLDELYLLMVSSIGYEELDYNSFEIGFLNAINFFSDKKFSKENMINFAEYCKGDLMKTKDLFNEYQSLQQTEWDVIVEMEEYEPLYGEGSTSRLKLDADGCLILKRKL